MRDYSQHDDTASTTNVVDGNTKKYRGHKEVSCGC